MDIKKLMAQADEDEKLSQNLEQARKDSLIKLGELDQLGKKSGELWNKKIANKINEVISDFKLFFETQGFEIINPSNDRLEAKYKKLAIVLSSINYDDEYMYIQKVDGCGYEFKIGTPPTSPDYRCYKENLVVGNIREVDFTKNYKIDAVSFVNALDSIDKVNQLNNIIEINKIHFEDSIKAVDTAELYILVRMQDEIYPDFNSFISSIDLG